MECENGRQRSIALAHFENNVGGIADRAALTAEGFRNEQIQQARFAQLFDFQEGALIGAVPFHHRLFEFMREFARDMNPVWLLTVRLNRQAGCSRWRWT